MDYESKEDETLVYFSNSNEKARKSKGTNQNKGKKNKKVNYENEEISNTSNDTKD